MINIFEIRIVTYLIFMVIIQYTNEKIFFLKKKKKPINLRGSSELRDKKRKALHCAAIDLFNDSGRAFKKKLYHFIRFRKF